MYNNTFILILSFILFTLKSFAEIDTKLYCTNLAKFTCAPGSNDDGTGSTSKVNQDKVHEFHSAYNAELAKNFNEILTSDKKEHVAFRKLSLNALGLSRGECLSSEAEEIKTCNTKITEGLIELASKDQFISQMTAEQILETQFANWSQGQGDLEDAVYIKNNLVFINAIDKTTSQLNKKSISLEQTQNKVEKIFPKVKFLLMERVTRLPIPEATKKILISKIDAIEMDKGPCLSRDQDKIAEKFLINASYNPFKNTLQICDGLMEHSNSEFDLVAIITHELAHSIDPCIIQLYPEGMAYRYKGSTQFEMDREYPIQGLILCLRSDKSLKAVNFSNSSSSKNMGAPPPSPYVNTPGYSNSIQQKSFNYCELQTNSRTGAKKQTDQIGEAVPDWFAAEIIVDYIKQNHPNLTEKQWQNGLTNTYKSLCSKEDHKNSEKDVHSPTEKRINAIFLANPKVRERLGCSEIQSKYVYCDAQKPEELMKNYEVTAPLPSHNTYYPAYPTNPPPSTGGEPK